MMPQFALSMTQMSITCNETTNHIYDHRKHLLQRFNQNWLYHQIFKHLLAVWMRIALLWKIVGVLLIGLLERCVDQE